MSSTKIILASQSPRRRDILQMLDVDFICEATNADETLTREYTPKEAVCELSKRKAFACLENHKDEDVLVIAADTVVVFEERIIGKPCDKEDAYRILSSLSGNSHRVYTGFTLCTPKSTFTSYEATDVTFNTLSDQQINTYISSGEPMDKAGAYGIQGKAAPFVKSICGDYFNVVGFPVSAIFTAAREIFGINL